MSVKFIKDYGLFKEGDVFECDEDNAKAKRFLSMGVAVPSEDKKPRKTMFSSKKSKSKKNEKRFIGS